MVRHNADDAISLIGMQSNYGAIWGRPFAWISTQDQIHFPWPAFEGLTATSITATITVTKTVDTNDGVCDSDFARLSKFS